MLTNEFAIAIKTLILGALGFMDYQHCLDVVCFAWRAVCSCACLCNHRTVSSSSDRAEHVLCSLSLR